MDTSILIFFRINAPIKRTFRQHNVSNIVQSIIWLLNKQNKHKSMIEAKDLNLTINHKSNNKKHKLRFTRSLKKHLLTSQRNLISLEFMHKYVKLKRTHSIPEKG